MIDFSFRKLLVVILLSSFCTSLVSAQIRLRGKEPDWPTTQEKTQPAKKVKPVKADQKPMLLDNSNWHEEIDKVMAKPATFDFVDFPLKNVASMLSKDYKIPFVLDKTAIEDSGYDETIPVTGAGKGKSLRMALEVLLEDYGLTYVHWNKSILITTKNAISNNPEKYTYYILYDISDLTIEKPEDFVKVIQRTIRPQSWLDTNGGPASISIIKTRKQIILSIVQTSIGHFEVKEYLAEVRKIVSHPPRQFYPAPQVGPAK